MTSNPFGGLGIPRRGQLLFAVLALMLMPIFVSCSEPAPTDAPTTTPPALAATAALATPLASATPVLATPVPPEPTAVPATPRPRPTEAPTAAPTSPPGAPEPTVAPVADPASQKAISEAADEVYGLLRELVDELGYRVSGTPGELKAAEILKERFGAFGYSAELQTFTVDYFDLMGFVQGQRDLAAIMVQSPVQLSIPGIPLSTAPKGGEGTGPLTPVPLESGDQAAAMDLDGKVALIQAAEISLADPAMVRKLQSRVDDAAQAGAVAAVIDGSAAVGMQGYRPLVGVPSPIPALMVPTAPPGVTNPMSQAPLGIEIVVSVQIKTKMVESQNVIAVLEGGGDGVVVVGAHYDIVPQTELGPNDNATGNAIVLSLAKALAAESLTYTVEFILFGAEEIGLYGSARYIGAQSETEPGQIKAMVNFDVVGTGPYIAMVGNSELTDLALEKASDLGIKAQIGMLPPGASSDHQSFERVGVPVLMLYAPDASRIHTPEDRLEFVQPERLGEAFLMAEAMLLSPELAE